MGPGGVKLGEEGENSFIAFCVKSLKLEPLAQ
jgi:hypothetical protein